MKKEIRRKNEIIALGLVVILLLALTSGVVGAQESVELEFPSWQATEPGFSDWWKENIAVFEKNHPEVKINFYQIPFSDYIDTLITKLGAGQPPDILHLPSRNVFQFVDMDWLEPLDRFLEGTDIPDVWIPLQKKMAIDGETYGVLLLGYGNVQYVNTKFFSETGTKIPENPEEFLDAARKLTIDQNNDGQTDIYGYGMPTITHPGVYTNVTSFVIGYGGHWTKNGELNFNDPAVLKGLNLFKTLIDERLVPMGITDEQKRQYFFSGRVAMITDGPWVLALKKDASENVTPYVEVKRVPFPNVCGGMSNSIHIPKGISDEKKDLAWQFIYQLTRPEWQEKYSRFTSSPPGRSDALTEDLIKEIPEMIVFSQSAGEAIDFLPEGFEVHYTQFSQMIIDACMEIATLGKPVEQVLNELERNIKEEFGL